MDNATTAASTTKTPSADEMLAACRKFAKQFPPHTIVTKIECSYRTIQMVRDAFGEIIHRYVMHPGINGIPCFANDGLPDRCYLARYASGHFEILGGWCEVDTQPDLALCGPISVKWSV